MNNGCYGNKTSHISSRTMATALDDLPLDQRFISTLKKWSQKTGRTSIELAVIGKAGQGKSSLINGIIGAKMAEEGDDFDPVTKKIEDIRATKNGIEVVIWETGGMGMDEAEVSHQRLEEMKCKSQSIDLLLYCIKMDSMRWPEENEREAIEMITEIFGKQIWLNCQFTLTFGNLFAQLLNDDKKKFEEKVAKFTKRIRDIIQKHAKLTDEEAAELSVVPVGDPHKTSASEDFCHDLPDGEDWFMNLFESCIRTMQKEAVAPLLQVRMGNDNSANPQGVPDSQDMPDLHSTYPTTTQMDETGDRSLDLDKENDPEGHGNNAHLAEEDLPHKDLVGHLVKQQVDKERVEEQAPGENGQADTRLDQQHVDNVQKDTRHDDQELPQGKIPYRVIQASLKKDGANLRQYIVKYISVRSSERRRFQGLVEGFVAWLETKYNMHF